MITVTEVAQKKIKQNLHKRGKGVGIRVGVKTTGCSGLRSSPANSNHSGFSLMEESYGFSLRNQWEGEPILLSNLG